MLKNVTSTSVNLVDLAEFDFLNYSTGIDGLDGLGPGWFRGPLKGPQ